MNYSDEPNVVSEQTRSKKIYFIVGGLLLFFGLLASVVLFPRILDYRRANTPVGPHEGSVYFISLDGERFSMELARSEELDHYLHVFLEPTRDNVEWSPEDYQVTVRYEEELFQVLEWNSETGSYGPTELRFYPESEVRLELEVQRGEETLWSGQRWSFRIAGEESHGHAH